MKAMSVRHRVAMVLATLTAAVCLPVAGADALPAATGSVGCSSDSGAVYSASTCASTGSDGANAQATLSQFPYAALSATASYPGGFVGGNAGASGSLNYSFEVVGGNLNDVVTLNIDTSLLAVPFGTGYAFAEIGVTTGGTLAASVTICNQDCATNATSFSGTLHVDARSGVVNSINLEVEALAGFAAGANGGTASADPYIRVDPGFAGASLYSIVQSDGVGNGPALPVPEPASPALMALGVVALWMLRRRESFSRRPPTLRRAPR